MKILVVAGEASADLHTGLIMQRLSAQVPLELIGVGGDHLQSLGLQPVATPEEMAVVGLTEALTKIPQSIRLLWELNALAREERPDVAVLVDLPDFNLRLAPKLKELGIPVVYFISPQVWAWRKHRVEEMARNIDRLLCILPFEKDWYEKNAPKELRVEYVGHPALEEIPNLPYEPKDNEIALLPGSRRREFATLLPVMLEAAVQLYREDNSLRFRIPVAGTLRRDKGLKELLRVNPVIRNALEELGPAVTLENATATDVVRTAKVAVVASGTATLECAVVGVPMVVVYRVSALTAFIFRNFVNYRGPVAMANLVHVGLGSQERLIPELLQDEVKAERIVFEVKRLIGEPSAWQEQAERLARTRSLLAAGVTSPTQKVVDQLLEYR